MSPAVLFAQGPRPRGPSPAEMMEFSLWVLLGITGILLLVGVPLYRYLKRQAEAEDETECLTDADLLDQFRAARAAGEMDEQEFERVSAVLRQRMEAPTPQASAPSSGVSEPPAPAGPPSTEPGGPAPG